MADPYAPNTPVRRALISKFVDLNWGLLFLVLIVGTVGTIMLYSIPEGGNWDPWAARHMTRFIVGIGVLLVVAIIDIRVWMALAYPAYFIALALLVGVEVVGEIGMGAQRWLVIGPARVQPSELMKIALVLALARYYHGLTIDEVSRPVRLIPPILMIALPVALVFRQPDLGTALLLLAGGLGLVFVSGINWWYIFGGLAASVAAVPVGWGYLASYQRNRILTFIDPERDPLGAGYHILQSQIAIGSGGIWGRSGEFTQSRLDFLPEKQTDFIFTMLAEQFGLAGAIGLLCLYIAILAIGVMTALNARAHFGRLVAIGVSLTLFLYVFINSAMVMGIVPVVGVPMPLVSYGGTSMMTILFGFGLIMCVHVHRDLDVPRHAGAFW